MAYAARGSFLPRSTLSIDCDSFSSSHDPVTRVNCRLQHASIFSVQRERQKLLPLFARAPETEA
jgi:hypothetical protein